MLLWQGSPCLLDEPATGCGGWLVPRRRLGPIQNDRHAVHRGPGVIDSAAGGDQAAANLSRSPVDLDHHAEPLHGYCGRLAQAGPGRLLESSQMR
jgi:hypothetical protein